MRLAAEGLPNRAIAARTGIPKSTIKAWRYFGRGGLKSGPSFPQHGRGMKHTRKIELMPWQQQIVDRYPEAFLRGLIYSDGCRALNTVKTRGKAYSYPRYQFANYSADIRKIFCDVCDALDIPWRQSNRVTISVSRREGVEALDRFIGPKS